MLHDQIRNVLCCKLEILAKVLLGDQKAELVMFERLHD